MAECPPYDGGDPVEWLMMASGHGAAVVVPCTLDGEPAALSTAIVWDEPWLHRLRTSSSQRARVAVALEACRRGYIEAIRLGAEVTIP